MNAVNKRSRILSGQIRRSAARNSIGQMSSHTSLKGLDIAISRNDMSNNNMVKKGDDRVVYTPNKASKKQRPKTGGQHRVKWQDANP